jgi:release factor glutamine methyltransferase
VDSEIDPILKPRKGIPSVGSTLADIKTQRAPFTEDPGLEAQVLLSHVTGKPKAWLLAHPEMLLSPEEEAAVQHGLIRLDQGDPLPYLLGHWEFYRLDFQVTPAVLIPRPETELLVEAAIEWLRIHPRRRRVVDVGTGSGAIAVTLAVQEYNLVVYASDISMDALKIAAANAIHHRVQEKIRFFQADLLTCMGTPVNLVCANLPYIPTQTLHTLPVYGREPTMALDGGADGLRLIRRLLQDAPHCLPSAGFLLMGI